MNLLSGIHFIAYESSEEHVQCLKKKICVSDAGDNHFIRIVLVEKQHLNLPSSPCNPDPSYNFKECVYEQVMMMMGFALDL